MRVKQQLLATAICVLPFAASAADLSVRAPAAMPVKAPVLAPAPFTWTGFYVGGTVGGMWVTTKAAFSDPVSGSYFGNLDTNGSGITGGVTAGFNYQMNSIVLGIEADYSFANISKSTNTTVNGYSYSLTGNNTIKNWGTLRGRLGVAFDRTLVYVTGGLAFAEVNDFSNFYEPTVSACTASFSQTRAGWTIGGGVEYAFTNNITAKLEGLYVDLGSTTVASPLGCTTSFKNTFAVGRAGLNFKF
jgi:outer membrane immunogenic protein